jgi:uncharacterized Zn-binding protein involved in type VI secretion
MPGPVVSSAFSSLSVIGHPSIEGITASGPPTTPNVLFNGLPAVVAGDMSAIHTLFIPPSTIIPHPGFFCTPTSPNVLVDGRPVMTMSDWYTCFCGFCKPVTTVDSNVIIA